MKKLMKDIVKTSTNFALLPVDFGITDLASLPAAFTSVATAKSVVSDATPVVSYHYFSGEEFESLAVNILVTAKGSDVASLTCTVEGSDFGPSSTAAGCWTTCSESHALTAIGQRKIPLTLTVNSVVTVLENPFKFYRLKTSALKDTGSTNKTVVYYAFASGEKA